MSLLKVDIFINTLSVHRSSRNPTVSTSKKEKQTKEEKEEKEGRWEGWNEGRKKEGRREMDGERTDLLKQPKNLGIKLVTSGIAGSTDSGTVNEDQLLGSSYEYKH